MERKYIAFISYKHAPRDSAIAKRVHTLIENYIIPKSLRKDSKKLGVVFRDEEELPISSDLTESICTALDASRYLIVICSREAKKSPWVAREVEYFLQHHDARDAFVVLADGEPNDVFPHQLTHIYNPATQQYQDVEPLAMDVRADSIDASLKRAKAYIKKLYAAMLGCSYDSLVQREKTRRMRRFAAIGALFVLLASCFAGVLFVKNQELSRKNDQLTAAIALALERESELLVEQADEAIQEGDMAAAIKYASDALYSEDVERPYYAPAERALFDVADVLREKADSHLLAKVALKHKTPVEMMVYSTDGSTVYTIDTYGTVSSFDSFSGDLLWSIKLRDNARDFNTPASPQLWYDGENGLVACYYDDILSGLDAATGKLSWQTEVENSVIAGFFFEETEQKLAYIARTYISDLEDIMQSYDEYRFITHSTRDGSVLHDVLFEGLTQNSWDFDAPSFGRYDDLHSTGMFAGADRFVGTFSKTENGIEETMLYIVALSEKAVTLIKNETFDSSMDYLRTFYIGNDKAIVLSTKTFLDVEAGIFHKALWLQCFDLRTGSILWESLAETEHYISSDANCCVVSQSGSIVLAVADQMYAFNKESGEVKASAKLKAEILEMHPIVDGLFAFVLADGYCAVGWTNQYGLHDSSFYSATVDLPDTSEVISYNGGLIQVYFTGNSIDGFSVLPRREGGGSVTYLSQDRCTAYVACALPDMVLPELIAIEDGNSSDAYLGDYLDENHQGKVLLGLTSLEEGYGLTVVDTGNHSIETIVLDDYLSLSDKQIHLIGDGRTVLICTKYGDIQSLGMDGSVSVIAESEEITLKVVGDMSFVDDAFRADAARQASDGRIVTARSDGRNLTFWMDGGEEKSVPLPDDVCWSVRDNVVIRSILRVGENSLVVLSDFVSEDAMEIENFVVYNLETGKWKLIPDVTHGSNERLIVFGQRSPVFAVCDADMNIRIYDWNAGEPVHCISTELPVVSVREMGMLLDDQYIYVLTKDGQFTVYCVATNEMVFHTVFSGAAGAGAFTSWLDQENARLYIRANTVALCVDVRTWKQLFDVKDFKFYSTVQNEVFIFNYDSGSSGWKLTAIPIPTTSELIDMARETLY